MQLRTAIHITSTISESGDSLREIAETARGNGISAVIFTDRDLMRWEYGVWPLRNVIKKTVENNSVSRYGADRYLRSASRNCFRCDHQMRINGARLVLAPALKK